MRTLLFLGGMVLTMLVLMYFFSISPGEVLIALLASAACAFLIWLTLSALLWKAPQVRRWVWLIASTGALAYVAIPDLWMAGQLAPEREDFTKTAGNPAICRPDNQQGGGLDCGGALDQIVELRTNKVAEHHFLQWGSWSVANSNPEFWMLYVWVPSWHHAHSPPINHEATKRSPRFL